MPPFDSTIALRADPYRFIGRTCQSRGTDAFETRLLFEPALCLTGTEAARFFYDADAFARDGAAPGFLRATLFGEGGVQGLDGAAHAHRKAQFLDLLGPGQTDALTRRASAGIEALADRGVPVALQDALEEDLMGAVCVWAGVPLGPDDIYDRTRMIAHLFEHAASVDLRQLAARFARRRADRWARRRIAAVRAGALRPPARSALARIAAWTDAGGAPLTAQVAAVELLNVVRPFVAVATFLTFAAHALATRPEEREALRADPVRVPLFVQEVRRTYPFFPLLVARARRSIAWRGHDLPRGRLVALDVYGTNRDARAWADPDAFRPERFDGWAGDAFTLIPQGGGDHATGHRCPGEWVTRDLMAAGTRTLLDRIDWDRMPEQDLSLGMRDLPALPRDRMRVRFRRPGGRRGGAVD